MLNSLNSGVAGLRNFQSKLDLIGNNIANSNTVAYKSANTTFADAFSQTLHGGGSAGGTLQVGSGVTTSQIRTDFSRGTFQKTGRESDVYINGQDGFFIVKDASGAEFATRALGTQVGPLQRANRGRIGGQRGGREQRPERAPRH